MVGVASAQLVALALYGPLLRSIRTLAQQLAAAGHRPLAAQVLNQAVDLWMVLERVNDLEVEFTPDQAALARELREAT